MYFQGMSHKLIKSKIIFGLVYALIWFSVISVIYQFGFEFPMVWIQSILESTSYSDFVKILSLRLLWASEFALHVFLAAIPSSYLIVRFFPDASLRLVTQISVIAIVVLSIILLAVIPKYIPLYFAVTYVIVCFIFILYGCVKCAQYITSALSADA